MLNWPRRFTDLHKDTSDWFFLSVVYRINCTCMNLWPCIRQHLETEHWGLCVRQHKQSCRLDQLQKSNVVEYAQSHMTMMMLSVMKKHNLSPIILPLVTKIYKNWDNFKKKDWKRIRPVWRIHSHWYWMVKQSKSEALESYDWLRSQSIMNQHVPAS